MRRVEGLREERGHRNTRGGREQTKPKINALHLLGQFAPSVGPRPALYTSGVDLFQGGVLAGRSLSFVTVTPEKQLRQTAALPG